MARYEGTGKDPEGRYPKGQVVDLQTGENESGGRNASEVALAVNSGWVKELDPADDPGRRPSQIANAIVRGDALADPHDAQVAVDENYVDEFGDASGEAYAAVHEDEQPNRADGSQRGTVVGVGDDHPLASNLKVHRSASVAAAEEQDGSPEGQKSGKSSGSGDEKKSGGK